MWANMYMTGQVARLTFRCDLSISLSRKYRAGGIVGMVCFEVHLMIGSGRRQGGAYGGPHPCRQGGLDPYCQCRGNLGWQGAFRLAFKCLWDASV